MVILLSPHRHHSLSLFLLASNASSRSLSTPHKTTVLNVVSSLQQTQHILSIDPTTTTRPEFESKSIPFFLNSSSPLTLELHSRDTLLAPHHKDYKSLVLSRLERDSSRVAGIAAKVRFSVEGCLYQVSYGDGSFTVGEYATDTVTFGDSGKVNDVALGCGHDNEGLFMGAAGLLGLGGGALSMTNQINATSFSYCLVDRDSGNSSSLDFNSVQISDGDATAPLLRNKKIDTFYYVGLSGFSVGGEKVEIPSSVFEVDDATGDGGVILDCGTAVTRLQTEAYNSLRDAFVKLAKDFKNATSSISLFDTCYDFSSMSSVNVPAVAFQFTGGNQMLFTVIID
ncbi:hypothetical protein HID58_011483 [Brassica napus]|uniref:Peptidase A1 domain-containing protein n=1 Tax=Brassica napus TaxID=3708 RepID=A0ABQ8DYC6_BRANA|nr:hypothetical protein HID58_011483 [Brassica napus]